MAESIKVKRQVVVKTVVTEEFRKKAISDFLEETKLVDNQITHIQVQQNQFISQLKQNTDNVNISAAEVDNIINELNLKLQQLMAVKQNLELQLQNINMANLNDTIITGSLENYIELQVGDNIYDVMLGKEVIIKDGIIQEIKC